MRSAQFGCNDLARDALRDSSIPSFKIGGVVESHIVLAGMCGGLGRAVVEGPTEFFKIRQQIVAQWSYREALSGLGVTMGRNTGLFSAFVVYMDLLRPYLGDSPFVYGATCSNLAWLTVWPFDVVKTQRQSGRHPGVSALALLSNAARDGALFRGLLPGLVRSSIANGTSMVVYKKVHAELSRLAGRDDHSNI
jgi:solute carrier family 25 carnitine/acylcarnitine transporter 20/29